MAWLIYNGEIDSANRKVCVNLSLKSGWHRSIVHQALGLEMKGIFGLFIFNLSLYINRIARSNICLATLINIVPYKTIWF